MDEETRELDSIGDEYRYERKPNESNIAYQERIVASVKLAYTKRFLANIAGITNPNEVIK